MDICHKEGHCVHTWLPLSLQAVVKVPAQRMPCGSLLPRSTFLCCSHPGGRAGHLRTPAKERRPVSPCLGLGIRWTIRQMQGGTADHVKGWPLGFDGYQLISIHLCDFNYKVCSLQLSVVRGCVYVCVHACACGVCICGVCVCMRCVCMWCVYACVCICGVCVCMWCMYGCMEERMEITALLSIEIRSIPVVLYFRCWGGVAGICTVFTGPCYSFTLA